MRSGGGKQKGSAFERETSRDLSLWLTNGERTDCFWRSAMSGGRATLQLRKEIINLAQSGDLTAISPEAYALAARCLFELKSYKDLEISQGLIKGTGNLHRFWHDTRMVSYQYDKTPILIAKQNFYPTILVCPIDCHVFNGHPIIESVPWGTAIYRFDDATEIAGIATTREPQRGPLVRGSAVNRSRVRIDDDSPHGQPQRRRVVL